MKYDEVELCRNVSRRIKKKNKLLLNKKDDIILRLRDFIFIMPRTKVILWSMALANISVNNLMAFKSECYIPCKILYDMTDLYIRRRLPLEKLKGYIKTCENVANKLEEEGKLAVADQCRSVIYACSTSIRIENSLKFIVYDITFRIRKLDHIDYVEINRICENSIERYMSIMNNDMLLRRYEPEEWVMF